jgi:hypothetical protein
MYGVILLLEIDNSQVIFPRAQYGAPGDFDEWARIIDDESWSWKNFGPWAPSFFINTDVD